MERDDGRKLLLKLITQSDTICIYEAGDYGYDSPSSRVRVRVRENVVLLLL